MLSKPSSPNHENTLLWLLKIISGVLIIVILGIHLVVNHLVAPGGLLTYRDVVAYFQNPLVLVMEAVFLACAVSHSLMGLRAILMDLNPPARLVTLIDRLFLLLGVSAVFYGIWLLWAVSRG